MWCRECQSRVASHVAHASMALSCRRFSADSGDKISVMPEEQISQVRAPSAQVESADPDFEQ